MEHIDLFCVCVEFWEISDFWECFLFHAERGDCTSHEALQANVFSELEYLLNVKLLTAVM